MSTAREFVEAWIRARNLTFPATPDVKALIDLVETRDEWHKTSPNTSIGACPYCLKSSTHRDDIGITLNTKRPCDDCMTNGTTPPLLLRLQAIEGYLDRSLVIPKP